MKEREVSIGDGLNIIESDLNSADLLVPAASMMILLTDGRVSSVISRQHGGTIINHPGIDIVRIDSETVFGAAWQIAANSNIPIA